MENCIVLKKPEIKHTSYGTVRLTADIEEPGRPIFHAFVEVEKEYEQYLSSERGDWLIYLTFPVAIRTGYDIVCEVPVTEALLHNINEILIPHYILKDEKAKKFKIYAEHTNEIIGGDAIGTGVSCGVDSTYTIMKYTKDEYPSIKLSHLFIGSVNAELWDFDAENDTLYTWEEKHKDAFDRYNTVSKMTGLPLIKMFTNIIWYVCGRSWKVYHHLYVHHYITMSAVLALRKLWKSYIFASSTDNFFQEIKETNWLTEDPEYLAVMNVHILGLPDFHLYSGGAGVDRIEKTRDICDYDVAKKVLHPCHKRGKINCSDPWCGKCIRALTTFDLYDKLDEMSEVFDIQRYKKNRKEYLWWLARKREYYLLSKLYKLMCEKYPEDMKKATESYEQWAKPIPRTEFDNFAKTYNVSLKLLSLKSPYKVISRFFKDKGIKKLYCSGSSNIGNMIVSAVKKDIECVTYKTGKLSECDAVYILVTKKSDIDSISKRLNTDKPVYSIFDIEKYINNIDSLEKY